MALDPKSKALLNGVHPDLVKVILAAAEKTEFKLTEGVRTIERERALIKAGKSSLKDPYKCRHVPTHGFGKAVDFVPAGKFDWNKDWAKFAAIAKVIKDTAKELKIPVEWGGDWKTFKDGPHIQLPYKLYP